MTSIYGGLKIHTVPLWQPTTRGRRLGTSTRHGKPRLRPKKNFALRGCCHETARQEVARPAL